MASQRATASWNMDDLKVQNDEMKSKLTEMDDTLNAGKEKYGTLLKVRTLTCKTSLFISQ